MKTVGEIFAENTKSKIFGEEFYAHHLTWNSIAYREAVDNLVNAHPEFLIGVLPAQQVLSNLRENRADLQERINKLWLINKSQELQDQFESITVQMSSVANIHLMALYNVLYLFMSYMTKIGIDYHEINRVLMETSK